MSNFDFTPQGWECPKCKRVYSPTTIMCIACPSLTGSTSNSTTGAPIGVDLFGTTSTAMLHNFQEGEGTSKTKCKICGKEKLGHLIISYT
jgi:RNA polymerase subunit RPABC4/transcription elongation factor Spt4